MYNVLYDDVIETDANRTVYIQKSMRAILGVKKVKKQC